METLRELLASIIMNPDEDTPRLMYADVLMDSDDKLDQQYGQYIKTAIELERHKSLIKPRVDNKLVGITYDDNNSYKVDSYKWYRKGMELNEQLTTLWNTSIIHHPVFNSVIRYGVLTDYLYDRGFISTIICTGEQWMRVCDKLIWHDSMDKPCPLTAHPIREVDISSYTNRVEFNDTIQYWMYSLAPKYDIKISILQNV